MGSASPRTQARKTRPRGFIMSWRPRAETSALIADAQAVLAQYAGYGPMTVRQIFYRLVATTGFDKTERAYKRLCEILQKARRAQIIPFAAIRDDGDTLVNPDGYAGVAHMIDLVESIVGNYTLRRDIGQPVRIVVMVEAAGMAPLVAQTAGRFGVDVMSGGGFDGVTGKHDFAQDIVRMWDEQGRKTVVLHIGDHDPSGEHVFSSVKADISAFVDGIAAVRDLVQFERLAVTEQQIVVLGLPTAPAKLTDARSFSGVGGDGTSTVQVEAIDPATLSQIVGDAILARWDRAAETALDTRETTEQSLLANWLKRAGKP